MATSKTSPMILLENIISPSTAAEIEEEEEEDEAQMPNHNQVSDSIATQTTTPEDITQSTEASQGEGQTDQSHHQVKSTATQSSTWDELATELVLEVITQQVTKIRGLSTGGNSSCVHIDGMTWKDIVAMIVQTHNETCGHTGVKLHHNMVGMTSSVIDESVSKGSMTDLPSTEAKTPVKDVQTPVKKVLIPKQKSLKRPRIAPKKVDGDKAKSKAKVTRSTKSKSKNMTPFEVEFHETVEKLLTVQGDGDASVNQISEVTDNAVEEIIDITQCPDCKRWFKSKEQLKIHSDVHSKDKGLHFCQVCKMSFPTEWDLQKHVAASHKELSVTKQEERKVPSRRKSNKVYDKKGLQNRAPRSKPLTESQPLSEQLKEENQQLSEQPEAKSQQPEAKSQQPEAESQQPEAESQQPEAESLNEKIDEPHKRIPFSCDSCNSSFKSNAGLKKHQQIHKKTIIRVNKDGKIIGKPQVKKVVGPLAAAGKIVKRQINRGGLPNSKCQVCKQIFRSKWQLEKHKKIHSNSNGEHLCPDCGKSCRTEWNLQRHILIHAKVKKHQCKDCEASFGIRAKLVQHRSKVHKTAEAHVCDECGMTYKNKITLKYHMIEHSGGTPFQCNICNKSFTRPDSLRLHQTQHKPKKFNCTLCPKAYPYRSLLVRHWQYTHSKEETVSCKYCEKTFQNYYQKNSHEETHTGHRQYLCQTCGKGFHQKSSLVTHVRLHTGEKPFKCTLCPKAFVSKSHATRHEKSHVKTAQGGRKVYECSFCESSFNWKHQWQDHENRHKGIKPHKCDMCQAAFVAKCDLNRHTKTHANKNNENLPHTCAYCNKSFSVKQALERHEVEQHLDFEMEQDDASKTVIVVMKSK